MTKLVRSAGHWMWGRLAKEVAGQTGEGVLSAGHRKGGPWFS